MSYLVDFRTPPALGTRITTKAREYRLERVQSHVRKSDGVASFVLHWRDQDGRHFTSGMRSKGMTRIVR